MLLAWADFSRQPVVTLRHSVIFAAVTAEEQGSSARSDHCACAVVRRAIVDVVAGPSPAQTQMIVMRAPVDLGFLFLIENETPDLTVDINNRLVPRGRATVNAAVIDDF